MTIFRFVVLPKRVQTDHCRGEAINNMKCILFDLNDIEKHLNNIFHYMISKKLSFLQNWI